MSLFNAQLSTPGKLVSIDTASNMVASLAPGDLAATSSPRKRLGTHVEYNATTLFHFGLSGAAAFVSLTTSGTNSALLDATGSYIQQLNSGSTNNFSNALSSAARTNRNCLPDITFAIKTYTDITNMRLWLGVSSVDPSSESNPASAHMAAFRYDTGVDATAFWRVCTKDGTTMNAQATTAAITADTRYEGRVAFPDLNTAAFYLNGSLVGTSTTNLPAAATGLLVVASCTNLAASARALRWASIDLTTR